LPAGLFVFVVDPSTWCWFVDDIPAVFSPFFLAGPAVVTLSVRTPLNRFSYQRGCMNCNLDKLLMLSRLFVWQRTGIFLRWSCFGSLAFPPFSLPGAAFFWFWPGFECGIMVFGVLFLFLQVNGCFVSPFLFGGLFCPSLHHPG